MLPAGRVDSAPASRPSPWVTPFRRPALRQHGSLAAHRDTRLATLAPARLHSFAPATPPLHLNRVTGRGDPVRIRRARTALRRGRRPRRPDRPRGSRPRGSGPVAPRARRVAPIGSGGGARVNPTRARDGWDRHTVVEVVTDDLPFVVDSVSALLAATRLRGPPAAPPGRRRRSRSCTSRSTARPTARSSTRSRGDVESVLADVRAAVADWHPMRDRALELAAELRATRRRPPIPDDVTEAAAFLDWLADDHFTFVGACATTPARRRARHRLAGARPSGFPAVTDVGRPPSLTLTKALERSTVHRAVPLDFVGVQRFDADGAVVGEQRFSGSTPPTSTASHRRRSPSCAARSRR